MMDLMMDDVATTGGMNALALEAAAGSRAAFSRLVSTHYDLIHRVALKWNSSPMSIPTIWWKQQTAISGW